MLELSQFIVSCPGLTRLQRLSFSEPSYRNPLLEVAIARRLSSEDSSSVEAGSFIRKMEVTIVPP